LFVGCAKNESVYWCGDHACANKKEKEAYFKKTMIVEMREIGKKKDNEYTELEQIKERARLEERKRIKGEKKLYKEARLEEKKRIKEEKKKITNEIKIKKENKLDNSSYEFTQIIEKINERNKLRSYPDINDIPN
jgi:hypothetical protein